MKVEHEEGRSRGLAGALQRAAYAWGSVLFLSEWSGREVLEQGRLQGYTFYRTTKKDEVIFGQWDGRYFIPPPKTFEAAVKRFGEEIFKELEAERAGS